MLVVLTRVGAFSLISRGATHCVAPFFRILHSVHIAWAFDKGHMAQVLEPGLSRVVVPVLSRVLAATTIPRPDLHKGAPCKPATT